MALHASLIDLHGTDGPVRGFLHGVGGRLHFYLSRHVRIGGLGASLKARYGSGESSFELGYGGLSAEVVYPASRLRLSAGIAAGGGSVTHLHIFSRTQDREVTGRLSRYGTLVFLPMAAGEYPLGRSLTLSFMTDYIIGSRLGNGHSLGFPKLQAGVLFRR